MGVSLGGIIITPLATYLVDELGWRAAWIWLGVLSFLLMVPVTWAMRSRPEDYGLYPDGLSADAYQSDQGERARNEAESAYTRGEALRTVSFYALVIAFGFFTINIVVLLLHTIPYLTDNGIGRQEAAFAMVIASIPAMLSKPFWGALIDRVAVKPLAALSASVTGLALLLIVFAVQTDDLLLIYAAFVVLGLGWGGMIPMQEVIWASFLGERTLVRYAVLGSFSFALGALAPWLVGVHVDVFGEYHRALQIVGVLNVLSGVLIYLVRPPQRQVARLAFLLLVPVPTRHWSIPRPFTLFPDFEYSVLIQPNLGDLWQNYAIH